MTGAKPRIMGLDIGDRRIGVAISDLLHITASALETIERKNIQTDLTRITDLARRLGVVEIVVGLPFHMDGSESEQARKIQSFCRKLARESGLPVVYEDERLSTVSAIRMLTLQGIKTGKKKDLVDRVSAAIILQKHLDHKAPPPTA